MGGGSGASWVLIGQLPLLFSPPRHFLGDWGPGSRCAGRPFEPEIEPKCSWGPNAFLPWNPGTLKPHFRTSAGFLAETPKVGISRVLVMASPTFGRQRFDTNTV